MKAKLIKEDIGFHRGMEAKKSLGLGFNIIKDIYNIDTFYKKEWGVEFIAHKIKKITGIDELFWLSYECESDGLFEEIHNYIEHDIPMEQISNRIDTSNDWSEFGDIRIYESDSGIPFIKHFDGDYQDYWISNEDGLKLIYSEFPDMKNASPVY